MPQRYSIADILTSELNSGEWSGVQSTYISPTEKAPNICCICNRVGPRLGQGVTVQKEIFVSITAEIQISNHSVSLTIYLFDSLNTKMNPHETVIQFTYHRRQRELPLERPVNVVQENNYHKNCTECINAVCGHNSVFSVNLEVHVQTTGLQREIICHLLMSRSIKL